MFWGLIMEPERRYTQQVKKSFHISMAALDLGSSDDEPSQIMCSYEGRNYLLCTLRKPDMLQCALDLEFAAGTEVSFASNGKSHIHLTGYLTDVDDDDGLTIDDLEEQEEEDVEEEHSELPEKKTKLKSSQKNEPPSKKARLLNGSTMVENGEEESDDPDYGEDEAESDNEDGEEEEEVDEEQDNEEEDDEEEAEEEEVKTKLSKKDKKKLKQEAQKDGSPKRTKQTLKGGVVVEDLTVGTGPPAKYGRFVTVYYEGRLEKNNKLFDQTNKGPGFKFRLGAGEVIKGWDTGVAGMKVGGVRKISCPPHTAYGPKGSPPAIPPNSTLVFTVTLKKVN